MDMKILIVALSFQILTQCALVLLNPLYSCDFHYKLSRGNLIL